MRGRRLVLDHDAGRRPREYDAVRRGGRSGTSSPAEVGRHRAGRRGRRAARVHQRPGRAWRSGRSATRRSSTRRRDGRRRHGLQARRRPLLGDDELARVRRRPRRATGGLDFTVNRTLEMPVVSVQGPRSREILQGLTDADLSALRYFRFLPERVRSAGVPAWVLRTGFSGELGFELIPDRRRRGDAVERALRRRASCRSASTRSRCSGSRPAWSSSAVDYEPGATSPYDLSMDRTSRSTRRRLRRQGALPPRPAPAQPVQDAAGARASSSPSTAPRCSAATRWSAPSPALREPEVRRDRAGGAARGPRRQRQRRRGRGRGPGGSRRRSPTCRSTTRTSASPAARPRVRAGGHPSGRLR